MAISQTNQENIEKYINYLKNQIGKEKKELGECPRNLSSLLSAFSQKAPSSSIINTLFKDEEPEGFVFSEYEEKRKQLAEQRRAEYNAFLEKKEAERFSKKRNHDERRNLSAKSILDSVDYNRVLAKRKEEEAQFRTVNVADVLQSAKPVLNNRRHKSVPDDFQSLEQARTPVSMNTHPVTLPGATMSPREIHAQYPPQENRIDLDALEKQNAQILDERIVKRLEEHRRLMLLEFENEIRKNNLINEGIKNLQRANSVQSDPPERIETKTEEIPKLRRTGGGGEPVRDSYGNMISNFRIQTKTEEIPKLQRTGGGGEPVRDSYGNMISNFRIETKTEEIPKLRRTGGGGEPVKDSYGNMITMRGLRKDNGSDYGSSLSLPSMMQQPTRDRMALYREELQRQIEEKKRLEALEKSKALELEERLNRRMEEQLRKEAEEYEREQKKTNKMKENAQIQDERKRQLLEFQRKDEEERRRKMAEKKPPPSEYQPQPEPVVERSTSPPIPAVRTKVLLEKAVSPIELFKGVKPENPLSSLAEIRRKIKEEELKSKKDFKNSYEVMNRRTVQEVSSEDEDDLLKTSYQSIF